MLLKPRKPTARSAPSSGSRTSETSCEIMEHLEPLFFGDPKTAAKILDLVVARGGIEPPTRGFSVPALKSAKYLKIRVKQPR
jgi:hypothetical protein